jgi:hypothetical protein
MGDALFLYDVSGQLPTACLLFRHDQSGPHGHYRDYVDALPPILLVAYLLLLVE